MVKRKNQQCIHRFLIVVYLWKLWPVCFLSIHIEEVVTGSGKKVLRFAYSNAALLPPGP